MNIDKLVGKLLFDKFGDKVERRDYYKLEKKHEYLKGKGKSSGLMYLVDVDYSHYIDVNIYYNEKVKLTYRKDDDDLMSLLFVSNETNINDALFAFISLVDEHQSLKDRLNCFSNGKIPTDLIRSKKLDSLLK